MSPSFSSQVAAAKPLPVSLDSTRPASVAKPKSRPVSAISNSGRCMAGPERRAERDRRQPRPAAASAPEREEDAAGADQPQAGARPGLHPDDGAVEPGDELGDGDDVAHAPPDRLERQPVEPERHGEHGDDRGGHHHHPDRRHRQEVREQAELRRGC